MPSEFPAGPLEQYAMDSICRDFEQIPALKSILDSAWHIAAASACEARIQRASL